MPFTYPTSAELRTIEPELIARGAAGRVGLTLMPRKPLNSAKVRWRQKDSFSGLQAMRGMDGQPSRVVRVGESWFEYEPGVFGEFGEITETELTNRAENLDVASTPINVDDLVLEIDTMLMGREMDRMEASNWSLLLDGVLNITIDGDDGSQVIYRDSFPIQTYSAPIAWSDLANATPIRNLQTIQQMGNASGVSVDFGTGATLYVNQQTANNFVNNTNASDIFGKRLGGGNTPNDVGAMNSLLRGLGLAGIVAYDAGYLTAPRNKGGKYRKFIPDGKGVIIGARPGNPNVGEYLVTRNANAGYRPESYVYTIDRANATNAEKRTPPNIERHRGHNGGPVIYYPSAVISVNF